MLAPTRIYRHLSRSAGLSVAAAALGAAILVAQTQPAFHTEANYVRVDVYATRDGVPVADLTRDDFSILDDGEPQRIEEFRRVVIPTTSARGTTTARSGLQPASRSPQVDAAARVFVLFLDRPHVDRGAAIRIQKPLVDMLGRLIGADDLVAVMTPDMAPRDMVFVRGTDIIEGVLNTQWGTRDDRAFDDPTEQLYALCYPAVPRSRNGATAPDQGIAQEMILRRREQRTLDAIESLVVYLRDIREERKAVLTITNGWRLFTPNEALARPIDGVVPSAPPITVDPRSGRLETAPLPGTAPSSQCDPDRVTLAQLNEPPHFQQIIDEANRANVSFYPIDPRGLVVFDEDIVPAAGVGVGPAANPTISLDHDLARLTARHGSLRTLADGTDGLAIVEHSNLAAGLQRVADDLSAYYLLGYYSSAKLNGKFHSIRVRVKRAGVQVRARRGYLAAKNDPTITAAPRSNPPPGGTPVTGSEPAAVVSALSALSASTRDAPLHVRAAAARMPDGTVVVSVVADGSRDRASADDWSAGGDADAMLVDASGGTVASGHARMPPGTTSVRIGLAAGTLPAGDYEVRIRAKATAGASASMESVRLNIPAAPAGAGTLFYRRGSMTANKEVLTADARFRRSDRLRVDAPAAGADASTARLLDKTGKPLALPVVSSVFVDADGSTWMTAQLALAPLAPGDYLIELSAEPGGSERSVAAFRIVP